MRVRFSTTTVERDGPRDIPPGRLPRPAPPLRVSVFLAPVSSVRLSSLSAILPIVFRPDPRTKAHRTPHCGRCTLPSVGRCIGPVCGPCPPPIGLPPLSSGQHVSHFPVQVPNPFRHFEAIRNAARPGRLYPT